MRFLIHLAWHANLPHPAHTLFLKQAAWHFLPPFIICMKIGTFFFACFMHLALHFPQSAILHFLLLMHFLWHFGSFFFLPPFFLPPFLFLACFFMRFMIHLAWHANLPHPAHTLFLAGRVALLAALHHLHEDRDFLLRMLHAFGIAFPAKCNLALPALDALLVALRQFLLLAAPH